MSKRLYNTETLKDRIDIVEAISKVVKLKRSGNSYTGFCPFHDNRETPAFAVWPASKSWRCFGACSESGDVIKFFMKYDKLSFQKTYLRLAQEYGIDAAVASIERQPAPDRLPINDDTPPSAKWQARGYALIQRAEEVLWSPDGVDGLRYLREERCFSDWTIKRWRFGYIPRDARMNFEAWGLTPPTDKPDKKIWLPRGIVIPSITENGSLWGIHIRRNDVQLGWKVKDYKTVFVRGSKKSLWGSPNTDRRVVVITGGEFDAALGEQEGVTFAGFCSLTTGEGSTWSAYWMNYLIGADLIIGALDLDETGQNAVWKKVMSLSARAVSEPFPAIQEGDKDLTDYVRSRGSVSEWIRQVRAKHLKDDPEILKQRLERMDGIKKTRFMYYEDFKLDLEAIA